MPGLESHLCPICGQAIPAQAADGLCPGCVIGMVMAQAPPVGAPPAPASSPLSDADSSAVPEGFGDYEILEEIGRGGMGLVYRARQKSLNRIVALKMMLGGRFATAQSRARFRVEAEATAHLQHPGIVAIHEVGEHAGLPYLVMDFVPGRSLDSVARDRPLPARAAAIYLEQIAVAVAYAHARGVLHRDLKPSNILIDANDQARITDFGLAKRLGDDGQHLTLTGQALGSPNFMPPEQAAGQHQRIGPASDVYGLGATLYWLITGRPPFLADTITATTRQVLENDPVSPRLLNPKVPRDLETICLKCLAKEPARRYGSAQELREELGRFLRDEPIRARPPGRVERAWRWSRRKPALAGALAVVALLSILSVATAIRLQLASRGQAQEFYYASLAQAQSLIRQGNVDRAKEILLKCPEEFRHWEWGYLVAQCHQAALTLSTAADAGAWYVENKPIRALAFDASSRRVSALADDGILRMWEIPSGQLLWTRGGSNDAVVSMVFHPTNDCVAVRSGNRLTICSTVTGRELAPPILVQGEILAMAWASQGPRQLRVILGDAGLVRFQSIEPGQPLREQDWRVPRTDRTEFKFTDDGERVALRELRGTTVVSWADGRQVGRFEPDLAWPFRMRLDGQARNGLTVDRDGRVQLLLPDGTRRASDARSAELAMRGGAGTFSPDGRWFCLDSDAGHGGIVEIETGKVRHTLPNRAVGAAFSRDGRQLVVMNATLTATVYDLETGRALRTLRGHNNLVTQAAFSPDGRFVATADRGGTLKVWNGDGGREVFITRGFSWATTYSRDGRRLTFGAWGDGVYVSDADSGRRLAHLHQERQSARFARFSPDGRLLATEDQNGGVNLWDLEGGGSLRTLRDSDRSVAGLNFSPDGRLLAAGYADGAGRIWDVVSGRPRHLLPGHKYWLWVVEFSPDGRWLATAAIEEPHASLWDTQTGKLVRSWQAHSNGVASARFHPDGRRLVTAGSDSLIRVWNLDSGRMLKELATRGLILYMDISPDGRRLAAFVDKAGMAGRETPSLQVWDLEIGRLMIVLEGHSDGGTGVKFHPDGRRLLTGSYDGTVRQWEALPWRTDDYALAGPGPMAARIERHAAQYWRQRLAVELGNDQPKGAVDQAVFVPFDRFRLPPRDPAAPSQLLDLSSHYTDTLDGSDLVGLLNDEDSDLRELPSGVHRLNGIAFDLRGLIRLRDFSPTNDPLILLKKDFPEQTQPIPIGAAVRRLHALGGVSTSGGCAVGTPVLRLIWRYADGVERETSVNYGEHLRNWRSHWDPDADVTSGRVAWTGASPASIKFGGKLRLYHFSLENPRPDVAVTSLQWVGGLALHAPFIVAMTVE